MKQLLDETQLDKLADILIAAGQVFLASVVVPFFFGLDKISYDMLISGATLMLGSWTLSILIVKGGEK
ncbi:MAG: hypothetical protein FJ044_04365 [Candidatus Cloacimonetes bacterium]|nr:hypothetical protein [Candidatus Cloacimonadota bacterium]